MTGFTVFAEAEYTYSQRKDIIPLLLQQGYIPDGWLGALVGTRIYFDLTEEETLNVQVYSFVVCNLLKCCNTFKRQFYFNCKRSFMKQVEKLIKELGSRGRITTKRNLEIASENSRPQGNSLSDLSLSSSTSSLHSYMRLPTTLAWGQTEVKQWLTSHQLGHVADRYLFVLNFNQWYTPSPFWP